MILLTSISVTDDIVLLPGAESSFEEENRTFSSPVKKQRTVICIKKDHRFFQAVEDFLADILRFP